MTNLIKQTIEYECNGQQHIGYAAWNSDSKSRPLVLVIHEWWGVNDYIKGRVDSLAELGYAALALDMYGGGKVALDPAEANELMSNVLQDMEVGTARLKAGLDAGKNLPGVDVNRCAAIGYCFGGAMVLHMARLGMPLKSVASFHGSLGSFHQAEPGQINASVLVCHGESDAMVTMQDVQAFKQEMESAKADFKVIVYPDAPHGFTSKEADLNGEKFDLPVGYQQLADELSWTAMQELFQRTL